MITEDRERWVDTMMTEELGYGTEAANPLRAAAATFAAFVVVGALPLIVYVIDLATPGSVTDPFAWSAGLTAIAFLAVGFNGFMSFFFPVLGSKEAIFSIAIPGFPKASPGSAARTSRRDF